MAKFEIPYLFGKSGLRRPVFFEIRNPDCPPLIVRDAVQHSAQPFLILLSMGNSTVFLAAEELQRPEFFTAIQTVHGFLQQYYRYLTEL